MGTKGAGAIVIDDDRAFISLGSLKKSSFNFLEEFPLDLSKNSADPVSSIKENSALLNQAIQDAGKRHRLKVDKIFLELPPAFVSLKKVTEVVPLKGKKRISSFDLRFVKRCLEDKYLDWDDFCIHNIAFNYTVLDSVYPEPPYGVWAKKLGGNFLLASVKEKVYKEVEDIFDNFNLRFSGFVWAALSSYASSFTNPSGIQAVLRFNHSRSNFLIRTKDDLIFSKDLCFSLKDLIENISKRFLLGYSLAEEVFERYVSFKETPYFKEITLKKDSGYVNLSIQTINSFVKDYLRSEISHIFESIEKEAGDSNFTFSFIGRLGKKEGFYNFLRDCSNKEEVLPLEQSAISTSPGCLRYGLSGFFELGYKKGRSTLQYIRDVYSEYF